ncbi:unnamed protein product [Microthlaspi erraticum]|uniref:Reverse transcriptase zinc-binding domain-containing protein n=1 Tax=Microthlaspi erraticum TaxID=1685480 RepID=A0A6D2JWV7_9BRAS|nr:unnamed protein product [Microthlaspi erraticum]
MASSHPSLWIRWVKTYLIQNDFFWSVKENTSLGSWVWRKLLKYRDKAKQFYKVEVNNGRNTSFRFDVWSPMGCLFDITGSRGLIDMGLPITATVSEALSSRRRRNHRTEHLRMIENLLNTYRNRADHEREDISLWKHSETVYKPLESSKKTWLQLRLSGPILSWYRGVWFTHSTPKFSFFAWLAVHN